MAQRLVPSPRYSILDREFHIPAREALAAQSAVNNQGRGETLSDDEAARVLDWLREDATQAYDHYEAMISQEGQQVHAAVPLVDEAAEAVVHVVPGPDDGEARHRLAVGGPVLRFAVDRPVAQLPDRLPVAAGGKTGQKAQEDY